MGLSEWRAELNFCPTGNENTVCENQVSSVCEFFVFVPHKNLGSGASQTNVISVPLGQKTSSLERENCSGVYPLITRAGYFLAQEKQDRFINLNPLFSRAIERLPTSIGSLDAI